MNYYNSTLSDENFSYSLFFFGLFLLLKDIIYLKDSFKYFKSAKYLYIPFLIENLFY